jgi:uncharacterized protein (DUF58 family)
MRPWQVLILIAVLAFFAITSGWKVLYILTYGLLALFVLSWFWARYSLRRLVFHRTVVSGRVQVGQVFEERLTLDNTSVLPKLWVQITDSSTLPGHRAGYIASMSSYKRTIWRARSVCRERGQFQLGPVSASSGDPFGFFRHRVFLMKTKQEILVLPHVYTLTQFAFFTGGLPGRGRSSRQALQATTNATTVREYLVGDPLSRIHWRSSAHHNKLMVKEFDLDPAVNAWIFLDLQRAVQAGRGEHSTEEYAVTIAATIANYLLQQDLSVGMIINGEQREFLALDRGDRQIEHVLELLAVAKSGDGPSLSESLALDAFQFGRNTVAIVITPSHLRDWHEGVQQLRRRGVQVSIVGIDAASFGAPPPDEDNLIWLESAGISTIRVRCKDPLVQVLESGSNAHPRRP